MFARLFLLHIFLIRSTHLANCSGTKNTVRRRTDCYIQIKETILGSSQSRFFHITSIHHAKARNPFHGAHTFSWGETSRGRYRLESREKEGKHQVAKNILYRFFGRWGRWPLFLKSHVSFSCVPSRVQHLSSFLETVENTPCLAPAWNVICIFRGSTVGILLFHLWVLPPMLPHHRRNHDWTEPIYTYRYEFPLGFQGG